MKRNFSYGSWLLLLVMLLTLALTACGKSATDSTAAETNEEDEPKLVLDLTEEEDGSAITKLMKEYFQALKKSDVDVLSEIMVNAPDAATVKREIEYIEDYQNITCFTAPGTQDGTYVAYIYYDVKFKNIDTAAPSMIREYICTNEDGNLYINNGTVDIAVAEWLDDVHDTDAVAELLDDVDSQLTEAAAEDKNLATLVSALGVDTETKEETKAEETTKSEESKAEESTKSEESKAEETTKAEESSAAETSAPAEDPTQSVEYVAFNKTTIKYTSDYLNVRKGPSTDSDIVGRLQPGKKITCYGTLGDWTYIKYGTDKAYILSELLTDKNPNKTGDVTFKTKSDKVVALQNVRLRKKPSTTAKSAGSLPGGTVVKRTGYNKKWTRIKYKGKTYYVATEYVRKK